MESPEYRIDPEINRRTLLRRTVSALAAGSALGTVFSRAGLRSASAELKQADPKFKARDKYGGCPDIRFRATGFFRLEHADRWWLVTPDGDAFLSFGVNHVTPPMLRFDNNREYWLKQFHAKDKADPAFMDGFRKKVRQDLEVFGFNTLGTHSPVRWYPRGFCPYVCQVRFVDICHWQVPTEPDFRDVFSDEFAAFCDEKAKADAAPFSDDPTLIGYSMTDCPIFTDLDAAPRENNVYGAKRIQLPTWPRVLRNLGKQAAGKRAYVDCLRELHQDDIAAFNKTYGTKFRTFEELAETRDWRPQNDPANAAEARDNTTFLHRVVDRYYKVAVSAIRKYDTNHMIFGDKLNGNTDGADAVLKIADKYMDLVYYQTFGLYDEQKPALDRWSKLTGKPLFNGDSSYSVPTNEMPDPYGPHATTQEERAAISLEFAERAFARPDFVGWNFCGWVDNWSLYRQEGLKQHAGLQTPEGAYYKPMLSAFSSFSKRMYDVASRGSA